VRYSLRRVQPASAVVDEPPRASAWLEPLLIGHFVAYPVALGSAVAAIPYALLLRKRALLAAGDDGASIGLVRDIAHDLAQLVLEVVLPASLLVLGLVHLAALPWLVAAVRGKPSAKDHYRRMRRFFILCIAGLIALVGVSGAAGWAWLLML
jgi:hypothetical protein